MKQNTESAAQCPRDATAVTAWKVRAHGRELDVATAGNDFVGVLVAPPKVGERLVICRPATDDMLLTSMVRKVAVGPDGAVVVETINSTYRLVSGPTRSAASEAA